MKRPVDQAKLLFFGLLRSVSSLEHQHPPKKIIPYFHGAAAAIINGRCGNGNNFNNGFLGSSLMASGISTTSACSSSSAATTATTTTSMTLGGGGGIFSIYGARRGGGASLNPNDNGIGQPQSNDEDRIMSRFRRPRNLVNNNDNNNNNNYVINGNNHIIEQQSQQQQQPVVLPAAGNVKITLRLAKRTDVSGIQQCNLATLPENYNQQFYINHLRTWPELAIVAEAVCSSSSLDEQDSASSSSSSISSGSGTSNPRPLAYSPFPTNHNNYNNNKPSEPPMIVAYVIGKVEERTVFLDQETELMRMQQDSDDGYYSVFQKRSHQRQQQQQQQQPPVPQYTIERYGHVTSLAVLEPYRRLGLARDLMKQLHHHMAACYPASVADNNNGSAGSGGVESVGLHVRQSNLAAASLYQKFGYEITQRIPHYYQDGEDAYLMTKRLTSDTIQQQQRHGNSGGRGSAVSSLFPSSVFGSFRSPPRPWDKHFGVPLDLQLPRVVHCANNNSNDNNIVYNTSNNGLRRNEQQPSQQDLVDYTSSSSSSSTSTSTTPELLTGTM